MYRWFLTSVFYKRISYRRAVMASRIQLHPHTMLSLYKILILFTCLRLYLWTCLPILGLATKNFPNCTWIPSRTKQGNHRPYWIFAAVSRCCSWLMNCFVLWLNERLPRILPVSQNDVVSHSVLPYQNKSLFFTKSSKRLRSEVMFENEHSWKHHDLTLTAFA